MEDGVGMFPSHGLRVCFFAPVINKLRRLFFKGKSLQDLARVLVVILRKSPCRYAMKCLDKKRIKMKQGETLALNERIMLSLVSTGVTLLLLSSYSFQRD